MDKTDSQKKGKYQILRDHTEDEERAMREGIAMIGTCDPVVEDKDGITVDGHKRKKIAEEMGIQCPTVVLPDMTEDEKFRYIILKELGRRHQDKEQRAKFVAMLRERQMSYREIEENYGISRTQACRDMASAPGQPDVIIGRDNKKHPARKPRPAILCKNKRERNQALGILSTLGSEALPRGVTDVRGLAKHQRLDAHRKREEDLNANHEPREYDGSLELDTVRLADIQDIDLPPDSVDMIYTDPLYKRAALPDYECLADLAVRALKPGAHIIVYAGDYHLPAVMAIMAGRLEWVWMFVETHSGHDDIDQHRLSAAHRLLLVFKKPGETARRRWVVDTVFAPKEKDRNYLQQAEFTARYYIEAFTKPGDIVLEPFSGTGTFPAVCKQLNRRFIAFDRDPMKVRETMDRLEKTEAGKQEAGGDDDDPDDDPDGGGPAPSSDDDAGDAASVSCNAVETEVGARAPASVPLSSNLPLERWANAAAGQMRARRDGDIAIISRDGIEGVAIPIIPTPLTSPSFVEPGGNCKTRTVTGQLKSARGGCGRIGTGHDKCYLACYSDDSGCGGCYGNETNYWRQHRNRKRLYNIGHNGVINGGLILQQPPNGDHRIEPPVRWDPELPLIYRAGSETSTCDLPVALGLVQPFIEANPDYYFHGFFAHYFRPSDEMLSSLASHDNFWASHSVSAWFSEQELDSRFASIERYMEFGIRSVIPICTSPEWDNESVLQRALDLVSPDRIIEEPLRIGNSYQEQPLLGVNPWGACADQRYDQKGRLVETIVENGSARYVIPLGNGEYDEPFGAVDAKCKGCRVLCGFWAVFGEPEAAGETSASDADAVASLQLVAAEGGR